MLIKSSLTEQDVVDHIRSACPSCFISFDDETVSRVQTKQTLTLTGVGAGDDPSLITNATLFGPEPSFALNVDKFTKSPAGCM